MWGWMMDGWMVVVVVVAVVVVVVVVVVCVYKRVGVSLYVDVGVSLRGIPAAACANVKMQTLVQPVAKGRDSAAPDRCHHPLSATM